MTKSLHNTSVSLQEKADNADDPQVPVAELQSAEGVLSALQTAIKNYPLYPHNHAFSKKLLNTTLQSITSHLSDYQNFKLNVTKEGFSYRQVKLSCSGANADLLGMPLRRDGIEWISLDRGISLDELGAFLSIVNNYRNISDDADGDLVTSFWKAGFSHLHYHAADILLDTEHVLDFSQFTPAPASKSGNQQGGSSKDEHGGTEKTKTSAAMQGKEMSISSPLMKSSLTLDSTEQEKLQRLIFIQDSRDTAYDVIDILLILLEEQSKEEDFDMLLTYIHAELQDSLAKTEFRHTSHLLSRLRRDAIDFRISGAHNRIAAFFSKIATDNSLDLLGKQRQSHWSGDDTTPHHLRNTLAHLPSSALEKLIENLPYVPPGPHQRSFQEAIVLLANQDSTTLARAVTSASTESLLLLVPCLRYIKGSEPLALLTRFCHHAEKTIRLTSLKSLLKRSDADPASLLDILDDSCGEVRQVLLRHLRKKRDRANEKALLAYIQSRYARMRDKKHIESCYRTLGLCGSRVSVNFLAQVLTGKPLLGLVRGSDPTHRRGAALALQLLSLPDANHILAQARRSPFPHVRLAVKRPMVASSDMS